MTILIPSAILTPTGIMTEHAVAFEETIVAVAPSDTLQARFPDADILEAEGPTLLMPGLINPHVHLEFSANKTTLKYGNFLTWLYSVIEEREALVNACGRECLDRTIAMMLSNGITAFGAISSHGLDLEAAAAAPQKVVFFNEVIGSQAAMADALYGDFLQRLDASKSVERPGFFSAVAVHSPYSVHPALIKRALRVARDEGLVTTAHYLESPAEREWLDRNEGEFKPFFHELLQQEYAVNDAAGFLELFTDTPTLMTHVVQAQPTELEALSRAGHTVIHCPVSNRLLGNGAIDLDALEAHELTWLTGTDGLSSNYALDLFEEMKIALFMHSETPLLPLARRLLNSVTVDAAKALRLNCGEIAEGKAADMLWLELDHTPSDDTPLHLLLQRYPFRRIFIDGISPKG
ncbi:aminofutalosine deaminase family hydrolase [Sulfurimonas diazotrophicus]|uniref:Aminofutalosine deaminase family hydrolase n=1 Tax=Sulfurimonas diazotrophicus TaxID=3131939 RepID=A0ABZ3HCN1_9BACT